MHEPGPPRVTSVGDPVELAPRDPDPEGSYDWRLVDAPDDGDVSVGDDPVIHLAPDAPGLYTLECDAPDGTHRQRVRVFPDERVATEIRVHEDDLPAPPASVDRVCVSAPFNEHLLARDRPEKRGDEWVYETRLEPGRHWYAFAVNDDLARAYRDRHEVPGPGRPRLTLDATVEDDAVVVEADPKRPADVYDAVDDPEPVEVEFYVDDRDADSGTVERIENAAGETALRVPLDAVGDGLRVHAVPVAERHGIADHVRIEPTPGAAEPVAVERPHDPPAWADSPTIYEVFVRSFAGDTLPTTFTEIERRVPYLDSLGVDVLWLTPVLASPTRHGYHITDFFDTAEDLGTRAEFESLVDRCHEAGIEVMFDLVINHTSRDHPAFQMHSAGVEEYADYYPRVDAEYDVTGVDWAQLGEGDMPEYYFTWRRIPNLNFDSLAVRDWLLDVVDEWAPVVDGFRADVAWGVPHGFWKEVAERVPDDFWLLDETLPHDPRYGEGEFHAHYDTSLYETLRDVGAGEAPASAVEEAVRRIDWHGFHDADTQMRYVENHDEERYLAEFGEDALRAAAAVTFTLPGAPMIYAGQERGNETYRGPIEWYDGDNDLTDYHRDLVALRERDAALRKGEVTFREPSVHEGDPERVVAYERTAPEADGARLVVVNFAADPATVEVPDGYTTDRFGDAAVGDRVVVDDCAVLA